MREKNVEDRPICLLFGGDLTASGRVDKFIKEYKFKELFSNIKEIINGSDYSVVNLECPVVENIAKKIKKIGPHLKCSHEMVDAIKYLGFNAVTLANNHFYDYGEVGAHNTIEALIKQNVGFMGAGYNLNQASNVLYKKILQKKFAFINCCEHEYSIATENTSGSNPLEPIKLYYKIKEAKNNADYVIMIIHGGVERYNLPTPQMQELYRFFVDNGVDLVINHHQHCYSGYEIYKGKPIFYGIGNFCFDMAGNKWEPWNEGYLVKCFFNEKDISFSLVPYTQCKSELLVKPMNKEEKDKFNFNISQLNKIISNPQLLNNKYIELLNSTYLHYNIINPYSNRLLNALCKRGYIPSFISSKVLMRIHGAMICESHYDRFLHSLNRKLNKI